MWSAFNLLPLGAIRKIRDKKTLFIVSSHPVGRSLYPRLHVQKNLNYYFLTQFTTCTLSFARNMALCQTLSEFYPPKPTFTANDLPDLAGKVYLVTGGTSGIGFILAKTLFSKNAKVYITSRSTASGEKAIGEIKESDKSSHGEVRSLVMDLSDLQTIVPAVKSFLAQETLLHKVWFNAGVMKVPSGSISKQGYELHWGTNVVGHFILNKLLMPILLATAQVAPKGSVRVVWVSSDGHNLLSPKGDGIDWQDITTPKSAGWKGEKGPMTYYGQSKVGNVLLAMELAKRYGNQDIIGVVSHHTLPSHY
jgi:NAD(P)-dependent dehydrogenase (short-subunit alcohol dehydrogenase family)